MSALYFFILAITMLLGVWSFYGLIGHIFFLIISLFFLILLIRHIIKKFKYSNKAKIIYWLEKKNYKTINPLNAQNDKPMNKNFNQAIWFLHKKSTIQNLKNIKFYFPYLNFNSADPLKIRLLVLAFFFGTSQICLQVDSMFSA